jgi:hypothetical protein
MSDGMYFPSLSGSSSDIGMRIGLVPEPATLSLLAVGLLGALRRHERDR